MNDMQVPFIKMHGSGNIILIVDQRKDNRAPPDVHQLRDLASNEPGFDQLMWISAANDGASAASYRVFNADGSEVQQCGNGVRCVAKYLVGVPDLGLNHGQDLVCKARPGQSLPASTTMARWPSAWVRRFSSRRTFHSADSETAETYPLPVGEGHIEICALSMGNPHAVLDVDDVKEAPVADLGPVIEHHAWFPELTNVGFMHIVDRRNIELRVHERGVGETAACGTGACAAVVSGQRRGKLDEEVQVHLPGGKVVVSWRGGDAPVWLQGNAELITEGMIDLQE